MKRTVTTLHNLVSSWKSTVRMKNGKWEKHSDPTRLLSNFNFNLESTTIEEGSYAVLILTKMQILLNPFLGFRRKLRIVFYKTKRALLKAIRILKQLIIILCHSHNKPICRQKLDSINLIRIKIRHW